MCCLLRNKFTTLSPEKVILSILALSMASATPATSVPGQSTSAPKERGVRGFRRHAEWPKVADAVIEASISCKATLLTFNKRDGQRLKILIPIGYARMSSTVSIGRSIRGRLLQSFRERSPPPPTVPPPLSI